MQLREMTREMKLLKLGTISLDGTKITHHTDPRGSFGEPAQWLNSCRRAANDMVDLSQVYQIRYHATLGNEAGLGAWKNKKPASTKQTMLIR